jgi:hypothetical protein
MSQTIKITVNAETAQAGRALGNFALQAGQGLQALVENGRNAGAEMQRLNAATADGFAGLGDIFLRAGTFAGEFGAAILELKARSENVWQQMAFSFQSVFEAAVGSISYGLSGLIEGTERWGQALREIGSSILGSLIQGIVQLGVRWVLTQLMMATMGRAILATSLAATAPVAAAQSAVWSAPATLSTIATLGASAMAAPGFIGAAEAMTSGLSALGGAFAEGGRPPLGLASLVGEQGPELFVPDTAGTILPAHFTHALLQPSGSGGPAAAPAAGPGTSVDMFTYLDLNRMMEHLHQSSAHEKFVVDVLGRHIHKFT